VRRVNLPLPMLGMEIRNLHKFLKNLAVGDTLSAMPQPQLGRMAAAQVVQGRKKLPIGPILLAFLAWLISMPSAAFGLLWCLQWMVPKPPGRLPIPEFLAYPFYILLWIASALAAIATISRPLGIAAILLCLVSLFWPRTPLLLRVITSVVLVLSIVGSWRIQAQMPSPTFPF